MKKQLPISPRDKQRLVDDIIQSRLFEKAPKAREVLTALLAQHLKDPAVGFPGATLKGLWPQATTFEGETDAVRSLIARLRRMLERYFNEIGIKQPF